jgi:hypothetical protein
MQISTTKTKYLAPFHFAGIVNLYVIWEIYKTLSYHTVFRQMEPSIKFCHLKLGLEN